MGLSKWKRILKIYEVRSVKSYGRLPGLYIAVLAALQDFLRLWLCCSSGKLCEEGASHEKPRSFIYAIYSFMSEDFLGEKWVVESRRFHIA